MLRHLKLMQFSFYKINAYRVNLVINHINLIIGLLAQLYIWKAVFMHGEVIASYTFQDMLVYVLFARVLAHMVFNLTDREMARGVQTGDIIIQLVRPLNLLYYYLVTSISGSFLNFVFITSPYMLLAIIIFRIKFSLIQVVGIFFSIIFAITLSVLINFLVGLWCFYIKNIDGILWGKVFIINVFSGLMIPINFFPTALQNIIKWLPFKGIGYIPVQMLLGRFKGMMILQQLGFQLIWAVILLTLGQLCLMITKREVTIQGG